MIVMYTGARRLNLGALRDADRVILQLEAQGITSASATNLSRYWRRRFQAERQWRNKRIRA